MGNKETISKLLEEEKALEEQLYGKQEPVVQADDGDGDDEFFDPNQFESEVEAAAAKEAVEVPDDDHNLMPNGSEMRESEVEEQQVHPPEEVEEVSKPKRISWKRKFLEMESRFKSYRASQDAKTFQLRSKVKQLGDNNKELVRRLDGMASKLATVEPDDPYANVISNEDIDILGPEAVETMKRMTSAAVKSATDPLLSELKRLEEQRRADEELMVENEYNSAVSSFTQRLGELVPDYASIDRDPRFMQFLQEVDTINGENHFYWFKDAQEKGNVGIVASYFKTFKERIEQPVNNLERHLTPSANTGGGTQPNVQARDNRKMIPLSEYLQFQDDVTKGEYVGRLNEAKRLDAYYDKAYNEGRIVPGR